jgi:hypothetical protein
MGETRDATRTPETSGPGAGPGRRGAWDEGITWSGGRPPEPVRITRDNLADAGRLIREHNRELEEYKREKLAARETMRAPEAVDDDDVMTVRIPRAQAEAAGLRDGDAVTVSRAEEGWAGDQEQPEPLTRREVLGGHIHACLVSLVVAILLDAGYALLSRYVIHFVSDDRGTLSVFLATLGVWQLFWSMWKAGVRLVPHLHGGILGLLLTLAEVFFFVLAPIVALCLAEAADNWLAARLAWLPPRPVSAVIVLWPVAYVAYLAVQGLRWALMGRGERQN